MSKYLILFLLGTAGLSHAATVIKVHDAIVPTHDKPTDITCSFKANTEQPELGRAWIQTDVQGEILDVEYGRELESVRDKVPGLSYDPKSKAIVFQGRAQAAPVVCATQDWGSHFKETGACAIHSRIERRENDNGYEKKKKYFLIIDLEVGRA